MSSTETPRGGGGGKGERRVSFFGDDFPTLNKMARDCSNEIDTVAFVLVKTDK